MSVGYRATQSLSRKEAEISLSSKEAESKVQC